jgi:hypothetical protein
MTIPLILCVITMGSTAAADDCRRTPDGIIKVYEGEIHSALADFKYESRAQRYSEVANKFTWCIENIGKYSVTNFTWGSIDNPTKYFNSLVLPQKMTPTILTDSSSVLSDARILRFRRSDERSWNTISPETVFYRRIGASSLDGMKFAQTVDPAQRDDASAAASGLVDLEKLSRDPVSFAKFVSSQGKIELFSSTIVTVPTSIRVKKEIESRVYAKYNPNDFARLELALYNRITSARTRSGAISTISVQLFPTSDGDERRFTAATREIQFRISLTPTDAKNQPNGRALQWEHRLYSASLNHELLQGPAAHLTNVDAVLSVGAIDSDSTFASLPLTILVPTVGRSQ